MPLEAKEHLIKVVQEVEAHASNDQVHRWHHYDSLPQQPVPIEGPRWCACTTRHILHVSIST